jgi:hypothetical protein
MNLRHLTASPRRRGSQRRRVYVLKFTTCYLGHWQSQGQRHARPGLLSPHSRNLSLWKHSSDIRLAGFGVGYPGPSLWLRPMYEAQGGLDLASRWTVLSADRRRIAGHAISVRNEDRGFSRLSDVWRDSDRNMHDRRNSVCIDGIRYASPYQVASCYITVFYHRVNPMREIGKLVPILPSQNARVSC